MIVIKMMPQKYKYIFKRKRKNRSLRIKYVTRNNNGIINGFVENEYIKKIVTGTNNY